MEAPLISIIIPVYNAADYIDTCLQSVLQQDFENWTAIIVDDGSIDGSSAILKRYAAQDRRFQLLQQENKGAAAARNTAIQRINTPYFCLLDADDYLAPYALSEHLSHIEATQGDISVAIYSSKRRNGEVITQKWQQHFPHGKHSITAESLKFIHLCGWNKLYKSAILKEHNILFPENSPIGEDVLFLFRYMTYCHTIVFCDRPCYTRVASSVSVIEKCARGEASFQEYDSNLQVPVRIIRYVIQNSQNQQFINALGIRMFQMIFFHRKECAGWLRNNKTLYRQLHQRSLCYQWEVMKLLPVRIVMQVLIPHYTNYLRAKIKNIILSPLRHAAKLQTTR